MESPFRSASRAPPSPPTSDPTADRACSSSSPSSSAPSWEEQQDQDQDQDQHEKKSGNRGRKDDRKGAMRRVSAENCLARLQADSGPDLVNCGHAHAAPHGAETWVRKRCVSASSSQLRIDRDRGADLRPHSCSPWTSAEASRSSRVTHDAYALRLVYKHGLSPTKLCGSHRQRRQPKPNLQKVSEHSEWGCSLVLL